MAAFALRCRGLVFTVPVLCLLFAAGCPVAPPTLDDYLRTQLRRMNVPGMAACIVKDNEVLWSGGYGWANIEDQSPATPDTLFMLASVSKTVTGTALMQLKEAGQLNLDDDINDYLPFPVRNPSHPQVPITFRTLLAHTSSIRDDYTTLLPLYTQGDSPITLADFVQGYLAPGGQWYHAGRNFLDEPPGSNWTYSNVGMTLAGYLVEVVSGMPFDAYCEAHIFAPLGMDRAAWHLAGLDPADVAMPYRGGLLGRFVPYGHYGYPDYPDGQLRASVNEFAAILGAFANGGEWNGNPILAPETVAEMLSIPYPSLTGDQALVWRYVDYGGQRAPAHGGGDRGVTTDVFFVPDEHIAVAVFTNGEVSGAGAWQAFGAVERRLLAKARGE
ncbi:MAG: serine hydrolase domain-containing protein [FCB group bacterium]|jgi:CubicO group peptidase (beta-lactamase class C family)|nr:serine hydrolase domain-containing protein [FCB group bacterium]